jgi:hypothetical protein
MGLLPTALFEDGAEVFGILETHLPGDIVQGQIRGGEQPLHAADADALDFIVGGAVDR